MSTGKKIALILGGVLLLIAVIIGGIWFYRQLNYRTVSAEVVSAQEKCLLRRSGRKHRSSREYGPMDCREAEDRLAAGDYPGFRVAHVEVIGVSYRSPADDQEHRGAVQAAVDTYPGVRTGDHIDVRAHTSDPNSILSIDAL